MKQKMRLDFDVINSKLLVYDVLIGGGVNEQFVNDLFTHMTQYREGGYHFIGWYSNETEEYELKTWLHFRTVKLIPSINMYISFGLSNLGDDNNIPRGLEITRHFESKGDGVGEISPINAVVGEITTPDSKTHSETVSDNTDKHTSIDDYIKAFRFTEKYNSLVAVISELICNALIAEFNTLY